MKRDSLKTARVAVGLLLVAIFIGVMGYMHFENYSFVDAFFMTIITISTVGFQEVHPLSPQGMWFTAILIIFSFGIFAFAVSTLTRYIADGVFKNYYKTNKVKQKIEKLRGHIVVCGYGRNGKQAVMELQSHSQHIVVIEKQDSIIEELLNNPELLYLKGDSTIDEVLRSANLEHAKALITTLPVDADNLFVVLTAKEINPKLTVISRASHDASDSKLKRAGANSVVMPDKIGGQKMAKMVVQHDVVEFLEYINTQSTNDTSICELICHSFPKEGLPLREIFIKNDSGANIVGIKRKNDTYLINPLPETLLMPNDKLFALATPKQSKRLKDILSEYQV
jgi:voltage-gated potassium channel